MRKLKVISHEPYFYYFLRDGEDLYLDVNCSFSYVGAGVAIKLNSEEKRGYEAGSWGYVERLAKAIADNPHGYLDRKISGEDPVKAEMHQAIMSFKG